MSASIPLQLNLSPTTPAAARRRRMAWTERARRVSQLTFGVFILYNAVAHNLAATDGIVPSLDALCPFGGVETLWQYVTGGGAFISKTHFSNLVLLGGLLLGTLLAGGAFCGWVCPFGAVNDLVAGIRRRLKIPEIAVPVRIDRILRYGRFLVLGLILYNTIATVKLWFADYDPYRTLFGLGWLFEFNWEVQWASYVVLGVVLLASFFVERAWCRYACPLGAVISLTGNLSLLRIQREGEACKACAVCERPCPVKLPVATVDRVSADCIGCLACVESCPRHGALEVRLAPAWLDGIRNLVKRFRPEVSHAR